MSRPPGADEAPPAALPDESPGAMPSAALAGAPEAAATAPPLPSLRRAMLLAVRGGGERMDYTQGDIGRAIVLLAVPMVLEMVMESVFAVVDVFFVSRLGAAAVATVGLTESMLTLVYTVAMGLSIGATATVARRVGEHDHDGAAVAAVQAVVLGIVVSAVIGVAGVSLAPRLLALMGASPEVIAVGSGYTRMMLGGGVSVVLLFLVNAIFRGSGDAVVAMRTLWLANAINIVLAPCLIFGVGPLPAMGVTGAAVATTIGRGTGALYAISRLLRPGAHLRVERRHLVVVPEVIARLVRLSGSGTLQVLIGSASWIGLVRILSGFGSEVVAGYTIGIRVIIFALLPAWGLSNAAATMVGQALGARKPERAEQAVWKAATYNVCFLGAIGLLFVLLAPQIVAIFTAEPAVARWATSALRIIASGFLFYAYGMVLTAAFNGAGATWTPTLINLGVFWCFELPLAWLLAYRTDLGPSGAFYAVMIAFSALAVVSALLFRRGTWKQASA